MRLNESFTRFHETIQLSTLSEERINSAWGRLHAYLQQNYQTTAREIFIQGSYANDTAVKPASPDGEYDLDIVCVTGERGDPHAAIEKLTAILKANGELAGRLASNETGRPCVRLLYADDRDGFGFHVDVVPAYGEDPQGIIEVPMRGQEGWRESAPYPYTAWCQAQPPAFSRVVRFLKRWRGVHADHSIASIVLQVLVAQHLDTSAGSDAETLTATLTNMHSRLSGSPADPPPLPNPVLASEDLSERWKPGDYQRFRGELAEAVQLANAALLHSDAQRSHALWQELLGAQFPAPAQTSGAGTPPPPPPPDHSDTRQQAHAGERYG